MNKKTTAIVWVLLMLLAALAGCGGAKDTIQVISREDGSGTRAAFIEIAGIEEKQADGSRFDHTTPEATITNSTSVMMTMVAGNPNAIGYISMGSMNDMVRGVVIDGVAPTAENMANGSYPIVRPFMLVTLSDLSPGASDFMAFILSDEGQQVVASAGFIPVESTGTYIPTDARGKVTVAGSSSVTPAMEKLAEAYGALNNHVTVEIQQSDSTTGLTNVAEGICDIGMASREVKESELARGLTPTVMAIDGIVVIAHNEGPITALTGEQLRDIYMGTVLNWHELAA